jgi:archaellum component FlaC
MKKIALALAALSLVIAPVALSGATAKHESKPKCSSSDVREISGLVAQEKIAKSKEKRALERSVKVRGEHAKAKGHHSKAKSDKVKKVRTLAELQAKAAKLTTGIAAQNLILETAIGAERNKALKKLAGLTKDLVKVNGAIYRAKIEVAAAENAVQDAAETVEQVAEEVEVVETEVEQVQEEVIETVLKHNKAKGKCKR